MFVSFRRGLTRLKGVSFGYRLKGATLDGGAKKAWEESRKMRNPVVMLIPARTGTRYFHDYIYGKAEVRFVRGRLKFEDEKGNVKANAPFPSMVVIWR